jgi:sugar phosphate isomerase/epimerase
LTLSGADGYAAEIEHFVECCRTRRKPDPCPPAEVPGALGTERPLGEGSVGIERFVQTLREIGFGGPLNIEREAENRCGAAAAFGARHLLSAPEI